jgi:hypothetical protein
MVRKKFWLLPGLSIALADILAVFKKNLKIKDFREF